MDPEHLEDWVQGPARMDGSLASDLGGGPSLGCSRSGRWCARELWWRPDAAWTTAVAGRVAAARTAGVTRTGGEQGAGGGRERRTYSSGAGGVAPAPVVAQVVQRDTDRLHAVAISESSIYGATVGLGSSFSPLFLYLTLYSQTNAKIIQEY
jgi:hypothetical protein